VIFLPRYLWLSGGHSMPDLRLLLLARDLRARAGKILARAETMCDEDAKEKMRIIAGDYEQLAHKLEMASGRADNG
jgi:hypothetical protein